MLRGLFLVFLLTGATVALLDCSAQFALAFCAVADCLCSRDDKLLFLVEAHCTGRCDRSERALYVAHAGWWSSDWNDNLTVACELFDIPLSPLQWLSASSEIENLRERGVTTRMVAATWLPM